jgi:hypothetical protein
VQGVNLGQRGGWVFTGIGLTMAMAVGPEVEGGGDCAGERHDTRAVLEETTRGGECPMAAVYSGVVGNRRSVGVG